MFNWLFLASVVPSLDFDSPGEAPNFESNAKKSD